MRYNAVFMKCLERPIGKESSCDNADVSSVQTLWFHEITFFLHEKHILLSIHIFLKANKRQNF